MDVSGKQIWITGASSGIGRALALQLAAQNNKLILSARREEVLRDLAADLGGKNQEAIAMPIDFSDADNALQRSEQIIAELGKVDILIHAAGISQRARVIDAGMDVYRSVMETNYFGLIAAVKAVLPEMLSAGKGTIVAISSVAGKVGSKNRSGYSGSKFAVCGFMDCLRAEIARSGVHCLTVCPGYVKTNIARNALQADGSRREKSTDEIDRGMEPDACAAKIITAIRQQKSEVVIAKGTGRWAPLLNRICPVAIRWVVAGRDM